MRDKIFKVAITMVIGLSALGIIISLITLFRPDILSFKDLTHTFYVRFISLIFIFIIIAGIADWK